MVIKKYLELLPNIYKLNLKLALLNVTSATNNKTNVIFKVINIIANLYYYIFPLLDNAKLYTRKTIDFQILQNIFGTT